jgi:hypothetical protein
MLPVPDQLRGAVLDQHFWRERPAVVVVAVTVPAAWVDAQPHA